MRTKRAGDLEPGDEIRVHPSEGWIRVTSVDVIPERRRIRHEIEIRGKVLRPIPPGSIESFDHMTTTSDREYEIRTGGRRRATSP